MGQVSERGIVIGYMVKVSWAKRVLPMGGSDIASFSTSHCTCKVPSLMT